MHSILSITGYYKFQQIWQSLEYHKTYEVQFSFNLQTRMDVQWRSENWPFEIRTFWNSYHLQNNFLFDHWNLDASGFMIRSVKLRYTWGRTGPLAVCLAVCLCSLGLKVSTLALTPPFFFSRNCFSTNLVDQGTCSAGFETCCKQVVCYLEHHIILAHSMFLCILALLLQFICVLQNNLGILHQG